jgi:hypothetical protein
MVVQGEKVGGLNFEQDESEVRGGEKEGKKTSTTSDYKNSTT